MLNMLGDGLELPSGTAADDAQPGKTTAQVSKSPRKNGWHIYFEESGSRISKHISESKGSYNKRRLEET